MLTLGGPTGLKVLVDWTGSVNGAFLFNGFGLGETGFCFGDAGLDLDGDNGFAFGANGLALLGFNGLELSEVVLLVADEETEEIGVGVTVEVAVGVGFDGITGLAETTGAGAGAGRDAAGGGGVGRERAAGGGAG